MSVDRKLLSMNVTSTASGDDEIMNRWQKKWCDHHKKEDMDIDSFKKAVEGVDEWFVQELKKQGYDDGQELVDLFTK